MDINLSSLHFFDWEILENTFKGELPKDSKQATFFTISNLFYLTHSISRDMKEWVEAMREKRHEFVFARGVRTTQCSQRCAAKVVFGLFKIPVTPESMRTSQKRPAEIIAHHVGHPQVAKTLRV